MINSVTLVGRTTRDIDLRYSQTGTAIANFNLAVNRTFKNANGEREADFINIVQFGKGAELTAQYVKKGHQIGLTGRIQTGSYEKDGRTVYTTDVVAEQVAFLEPREKQNNQQPSGNTGQFQQQPNQQPPQQQSDPFKNEGQPIDIGDDDLPF